MKWIIILLLCFFSQSNVIAHENIDDSRIQRDPEQVFLETIEAHGFEDGVLLVLTGHGLDFIPVLIKYREKTEPIIRKVLNNPNDYDSQVVFHACWKSYKLGLTDQLDIIHGFANQSKDKKLQFIAREVFVKSCSPDQFPELLKMMVSEDASTVGSIISTIRKRKDFDPNLLERWRDDQLEKDKKRDKKIMREWFVKEINETIKVLKEEQNKKSAQDRKETKIPKVE